MVKVIEGVDLLAVISRGLYTYSSQSDRRRNYRRGLSSNSTISHLYGIRSHRDQWAMR